MRTVAFATHDSTTLGCMVRGAFIGDTSDTADHYVDAFPELVDSASGAVVCRLDSFRISAIQPMYTARPEVPLDLLSGTYYIRLRAAALGLPAILPAYDSRYAVVELARAAVDQRGTKRAAQSAYAGRLRLAASPRTRRAARSTSAARSPIDRLSRLLCTMLPGTSCGASLTML